jgi:ABC-type microcin C transport system duplicated ATPase subunit YejF
MRNDEATGLVNLIQQNLNDNALNLDQSNRLQRLVKAELDDLKLDDTDLFRTPDDWVQFVGGHQQNVLNQAAAFLTPAQLDGLKNLAALDMAQKKEAMMLKRKSLGIK